MHHDLTFTIDCTGDVVAGDVILFTEAVFTGSYKKPKFAGERRIAAEVIRDSYGAAKQQHTFTLKVLWSDGVQPLEAGTQTTRKGRNIYRQWTLRQRWDDEEARTQKADEKHLRGAAARKLRDMRLAVL